MLQALREQSKFRDHLRETLLMVVRPRFARPATFFKDLVSDAISQNVEIILYSSGNNAIAHYRSLESKHYISVETPMSLPLTEKHLASIVLIQVTPPRLVGLSLLLTQLPNRILPRRHKGFHAQALDTVGR
jgi:hypothetical protein